MPFIVDVLSVCVKVSLINQYILYSQYFRPLGLLKSLIKKNCNIYLSKVKTHNCFLFPGFHHAEQTSG